MTTPKRAARSRPGDSPNSGRLDNDTPRLASYKEAAGGRVVSRGVLSPRESGGPVEAVQLPLLDIGEPPAALPSAAQPVAEDTGTWPDGSPAPGVAFTEAEAARIERARRLRERALRLTPAERRAERERAQQERSDWEEWRSEIAAGIADGLPAEDARGGTPRIYPLNS